MPKKLFLIGIGGTGMRCLESFVHTCAMGMYDDTEVEMLALDTDADNGNFKRLTELVNLYNIVNGGKIKSDTFFSAKIKYYQFCPGYKHEDSFASLVNYTNLDTHRKEEEKTEDRRDPTADFVDLFISPDVRNMSLKDGYRAQTQMGSLLMYYAIEKAAYEAKNNLRSEGGFNDLRDFLSALNAGSRQPVFIFGSVFGGTGASSIPIIPLAFNKAAAKISNSNRDIVADNYFGSIVLTNYFKFDVKGSLNEVVARSENFAVNSQAALMFYSEDATVAATYKRLYLLGRKSLETRDVLDKDSGGSKGVTGGGGQRNPADYIELLAAFAAYDFFKEAEKPEPFEDSNERFYCISHDFGKNKLDFRLFAHEDERIFKEKAGALTVASLLTLKGTDFFRSMANSGNMFETVDPDGKELAALQTYLAMYNIGLDESENVTRGWLPQMYKGKGGQGLLFSERMIDCASLKDIKKFKYNKDLFVGDNPPKFEVGLFSSIFDEVKKKFIATLPECRSTFDDLISRTYATIKNLYFNE